eukprot:4717348-Heterocapsa_arctica.AAC.1
MDCEAEFCHTVAEQAIFHQKGFGSAPKRCKDCRREKRTLRSAARTPTAPLRSGRRSKAMDR